MTQRNLYIAFIFTIISVYSVSAQTNRTKTLINAALHGWEYEVRAGFSIGGTSPIPLPAEIRSINSYNPSLANEEVGYRYRNSLGKPQDEDRCYSKEL